MCHVWHIEWDHLHMHMWAQRYTCTTISPCISLTIQMQLPSMLSEHGYDQLTSKCIGASVHVQLLIFATSPCHLCMYSAGLGSCMPTGSLGGCCHRSWVGASRVGGCACGFKSTERCQWARGNVSEMGLHVHPLQHP